MPGVPPRPCRRQPGVAARTHLRRGAARLLCWEREFGESGERQPAEHAGNIPEFALRCRVERDDNSWVDENGLYSGLRAAIRRDGSAEHAMDTLRVSDAPEAAVAAALAELDACRERLRDTEAQLEIALALVVAARARESLDRERGSDHRLRAWTRSISAVTSRRGS